MKAIGRRQNVADRIIERTGIDEAMIERLVHEFYLRIRQDRLLASVFEERIADWDAHLDRMCVFWSSIVLLSGTYYGRLMDMHLPLPIGAQHFTHWLSLFEKTARDLCSPEAAEYFIDRAKRVSDSLKKALENRKSGEMIMDGDDDLPKYARETSDPAPPVTELLFRADAYLTETEATVIGIDPDNGVEPNRTVCYVRGGGQPGDIGRLIKADGSEYPIEDTFYSPDRSRILHRVPDPGRFSPGEQVRIKLDWAVRLPRMKIHTALHLLSVILPFPVTGGAIGDGTGRLDFDIPDADFDKEQLTAQLNELIKRDAAVTEHHISEQELDANPHLVKTLSVQPPRGSGTIRLVAIEGLDLQPCGGTHVHTTSEIGAVTVTSIEKKGKLNRRVRIALV